MNKFELNIIDKGKSLKKPEYYLNLIIDEKEFLKEIDDSVVYFDALKKSSYEEGLHLIFTCSCGIADCGGWDYIKVKHQESNIIWDFKYENDYHFEFDKLNYKTVIRKIKTEIESKRIDIEPIFVAEPE